MSEEVVEKAPLPAWGEAAGVFVAVSAIEARRGIRGYIAAWMQSGPHMALTLGLGMVMILGLMQCRGTTAPVTASAYDDTQEAALVQETCESVAPGSLAKTVGGEWGCYDRATGALQSAIYADSAPAPVATGVPTPVSWGAGIEPGVMQWAGIIEAAATKHGVSPRLLACMMTIESHGNPKAHSPAGADGLLQIVKDPYHPDYDIERGRAEPAYNVDYGATFLASLIKQNGGNIRTAVCQYNGGGRCEQYAESRKYMAFVLPCSEGGV